MPDILPVQGWKQAGKACDKPPYPTYFAFLHTYPRLPCTLPGRRVRCFKPPTLHSHINAPNPAAPALEICHLPPQGLLSPLVSSNPHLPQPPPPPYPAPKNVPWPARCSLCSLRHRGGGQHPRGPSGAAPVFPPNYSVGAFRKRVSPTGNPYLGVARGALGATLHRLPCSAYPAPADRPTHQYRPPRGRSPGPATLAIPPPTLHRHASIAGPVNLQPTLHHPPPAGLYPPAAWPKP